MKSFLTLFLTLLLPLTSFAAEYYVAKAGKDTAAGTKEAPLQTIAAGVAKLKPGDTLWVREGNYREDVTIADLHGHNNAPITVAAYSGEKVTLDGTISLQKLDWQPTKGGILAVSYDGEPVTQLFEGRNMVTLARWPNIHCDDPDYWNQKVSFRKFAPDSVFGKITDTKPTDRSKELDKLADEGVMLGVEVPKDKNNETLAQTGKDMTGAIAILNMGSWMSWPQYIESHKPGENTFTFSKDFSTHNRSEKYNRQVQKWANNPEWWQKKNIHAEEGHYFLEGLTCLDQPGEWWYDHQKKKMYLFPSSAVGSKTEIRGKVSTYALTLQNCSHVTVRGLNFFATTFRVLDCQQVTLCDLVLDYPNYNRRVLGDFALIPATLFETTRDRFKTLEKEGERAEIGHNTLRNCRFSKTDGPALVVQQDHNITIENCLFEEIDYSCLGDALTVALSENATFTRCTIRNAGASECVKGVEGVHISYSLFENIGKLQHDGTATQFGSFQKTVEVDHNWSFDHPKNGFRFDGGGGPPRPPSQFGRMHHNVTWNTRGFIVKGDRHLVANNTALQTYKDFIIMIHPPMNGVNEETITVNNLAPRASTRWWGKAEKRPPIPGVVVGNVFDTNAAKLLCDPENFDFRPKKSAVALIDTGDVKAMKKHPHYADSDFTFVGKSPDVGAYEYGDKRYWIPGFQYPHASFPIPPNGSTNAKCHCDLMFRSGYQAVKHVVSFGDSPKSLAQQKTLTDTNIFTPGKLEAGKKYYWRVDAIDAEGNRVTGPVWTFQVK